MPRPVVIENWKGVKLQELIVYMGRGLTPEEEVIARNAGVDMGKPVEIGPSVDQSGWELGDGGGAVKVNSVAAGEFYAYSFNVSQTQTAAEIDIFGAPGKFFNSVTIYVTSPGGMLVVPTHEAQVIGFNHKELFSVPGPGKYNIYIKVDKPGTLGVQYNQR